MSTVADAFATAGTLAGKGNLCCAASRGARGAKEERAGAPAIKAVSGAAYTDNRILVRNTLKYNIDNALRGICAMPVSARLLSGLGYIGSPIRTYI